MRAQRRDEKFVVPLEQGHGRNATEPLVGEIVMLGCDGVPADFFVRCFLYRAATGFGEQLSAQTVTDDGNAERRFRDIREHVGEAPDDASLDAYLDRILDGEAGDRSGKIYGLGHAVYTMSDPRAVVIKKYARRTM